MIDYEMTYSFILEFDTDNGSVDPDKGTVDPPNLLYD